MQPELQPNVDLTALAAIAAFNPAVIGVGLWMGRQCDQPQKILIAGMAAAIAGMALVWLAATLRFGFIADPARASGGIFVTQWLFGMLWALIGYRFLKRT
jgi:hypothetical protein